MPFQIGGLVASLRWGYTQAAALRGWTVTALDEGGFTLTATIESVNTLRVSQSPLVFEAPYAKGAFRWPVMTLQMQESALTARLGPQER